MSEHKFKIQKLTLWFQVRIWREKKIIFFKRKRFLLPKLIERGKLFQKILLKNGIIGKEVLTYVFKICPFMPSFSKVSLIFNKSLGACEEFFLIFSFPFLFSFVLFFNKKFGSATLLYVCTPWISTRLGASGVLLLHILVNVPWSYTSSLAASDKLVDSDY